jgi:hypothetical protein
MDAQQRDAVALWAVFTHTHDLRDFAPLLIAKSAIKRSGKSRLAEIMERLAPRPLYIAGLTTAFIERAIEDHRPTLIIDEADRIRKGDQALAERIDAQFNRSFRRAIAKVGKNVPLPGGGHEPRVFSTWAATFIAGIGKQADTAEDRAVISALKRKLSTEKVKQLRAKDGADLVVLARKIARFVADNEVRLRTHEPVPLEIDNDRAKDVWEPLLAIAETAGGEWQNRARKAAKELSGETEEEEEEFKSGCSAIFVGCSSMRSRSGTPPVEPGWRGVQTTAHGYRAPTWSEGSSPSRTAPTAPRERRRGH